MTPRYKAVLFDCDGTVANTLNVIVSSYQHAFETVLGKELESDEAKSFMGMPLKDTFKEYSPDRWQEMVDVYRRFNSQHLERLIERYEGMNYLLEDLNAAGVKIGVVTSKRRIPAEQTLQYVGIGGLIPVLAGLDDTEIHKPNAYPLLFALDKLDAEPSQAAYVGDSVFDLQAANNAKMDGIGVTWGAADRQTLETEKPVAIFDTVAELGGFLLG